MMKNFKYAILMAVAIVLGFSSCSSDDENGGGTDNSQLKSVFLKISNGPVTYSEGGSVVDDSAVTFTDGQLFFVNGSGAILDKYTISSAATAGNNINMADITTGTGVSLSNLNGGILAVHIIGNVPTGVDLTNGGINTNIDQVKATALSVTTQGDITDVSLYGTKTLTYVSGVQYKAEVDLKPIVARIELKGISAGGAIDGFQVDGIFVDNYYPQGRIDGTITSTPVNNGTTPATFIGDNTSSEYPATLNPSIYDWYASGMPTVSKVAAPTGDKVWGYNLFATTAGSAVARIVIRLSNFTTNDGSTIGDPQFVTIKGMKDGVTPLTAIKAGEVYSIAENALVINEKVVTPNPNQSTIDVEVKVTLAKWKVIAITPEL